MAKKNPFVETFQQALVEAGVTVRVTGLWSEQTKNAMQTFQDESGLDVTDYPNADTLALLGVHPSAWVAVTLGAGAPKTLVANVSSVAKKQQALEAAEAMKTVFEPAKVGRVGRAARPGEAVAPPARVGERVPYPGAVVPSVPGVQPLPTAPLLPKAKPKMPVWGWVILGLGGVVVVGSVVYVVARRRGAAG